MVLNATFNNILVLSWQSVLLVEEMAPTCEKNVQIKLTPKNFLLIIFNVVYIEVNETRKKLWTDK
jgi:hypothetical protein